MFGLAPKGVAVAIVRSGENAVTAAERALLETEQRIVELETAWKARIDQPDGDYVADTAKIEREIDNLRSAATVHRERIMAMRQRQNLIGRALREQLKQSAVAAIEKTLSVRLGAARKLDKALADVAEAYGELAKADAELFSGWPDVLPPAHMLIYLRAMRIEALSINRKQKLVSGAVHQVIERLPLQFAEQVAKDNADLLDELKKARVPEPEEVAAA
jgi:hypothetical protein